jgi:hypothetical protein
MTAAAILSASLAAMAPAFAPGAGAQTAAVNPAQPISFEQFPATEQYAGRPVRPNIATSPSEANFAGYMEQAQSRSGVNFAGAYTIATWPCLSLCVSVVAIDARTGAIVRAPEAYNGLAFRRDSRLLVINPPQNMAGANQPAELRPEYYEFTGTAFRRIDNPDINTPGTFSPRSGALMPPLQAPNAPPPPDAAPGWGTGAYGSTLNPDPVDATDKPPFPPPGVGAGALPLPPPIPMPPPDAVTREPLR